MTAPSCKKYRPAPAVFLWKPSAVTVETAGTQGSGSHNITDYWLYVNKQFQGVYPAGSLMPIVSHGQPVQIEVLPGIKNNGISATRIWWPFYQSFKLDTTAAPGSTITTPIRTAYNTSTTFTWTENFEGIGVTLEDSDLSDTNYRLAGASDRYEGQSLELGLRAPHTTAQVESSGLGFVLPHFESNVYLEFDYKCNHQFSAGLLGDDGLPRPALIINPSSEWNKIYIQLAQPVNTPQTSSRYRVYFRMVRSESEENPRLFLDNIKLVYL